MFNLGFEFGVFVEDDGEDRLILTLPEDDFLDESFLRSSTSVSELKYEPILKLLTWLNSTEGPQVQTR